MKYEVLKLHEGRDDVTLTAYVLDNSPEMLNGTLRPAVLICPGGAYLNCSDREGEPIAMGFAAIGYHAFVLRYSVYDRGKGGFPDLSRPLEPSDHCRHPGPVRDIAAAMLAIRARAEEWRVDTGRIAVCGFSAGAHNCAMYATCWHLPLITEHFGRNAEEFRPAAAILCYGISDYFRMRKAAADPMAAAMFSASNTAFLGCPEPDDAALDAVSPARHVTGSTPPTFLWATAEDALVPVQQTTLMANALAEQHIPFEVHIFESGPHGLSTATQASAMSRSTIDADAAHWLPLCDSWLQKRFALALPDLAPWERGEF